jgi:hypothetical protein
MTATAIQPDFLASLFRPFVKVEAAAWWLGASYDHIVRMVEAGELIGFNIAPAERVADADIDERERKRLLRILRPSVERLTDPRLLHLPLGGIRLDDAVGFYARPHLLLREVAQILDCHAKTVRRLREEGLLAGPKLTQHGSGRLEHFDRTGLLAFLHSRRIG